MAQHAIQFDPVPSSNQVVTILLMREGDSRQHETGDECRRELTSRGYSACIVRSRDIRELEIAVDLKIVSPVVCADQTGNDVFGSRVPSVSCPELRVDSAHNAMLLETLRGQPEANLECLFEDPSTESALLGFGQAAARIVALRILEAETAPKTVAVIAENGLINAIGFAIALYPSDAKHCMEVMASQTEYVVIEVTLEHLRMLAADA